MSKPRRKLKPRIVESDWFGLYREKWTGLIVEAAITHPAKFSRGLIRKIYQHCFDEGWLAAGSSVCDPFGGVALGAHEAIHRGLHWLGCELEPRFVELGNQNIGLWLEYYSPRLPNCGTARLVQGDSRRLREVISEASAMISSPPFTGVLNDHMVEGDRNRESFKRLGRSVGESYGNCPGNLGNLAAGSLDAAISSPPYANETVNDRNGIDPALIKSRYGRNSQALKMSGYSTEASNLGNLPNGDLDAVISSPPFLDARSETTRSTAPKCGGPVTERHHTANSDCGGSDGNLGHMPEGEISAVIASPPFAESLASDDPDKRGGLFTKDPKRRNDRTLTATYGESEGQVGGMPPGDFDAVISSPPFESCLANAANAPEVKIVRPYLPEPAEVAAYLKERRLALGLSKRAIDDELGTSTLYSWFEGRPAGTEVPVPEIWQKLRRILDLDDRFDYGIMTEQEVEAIGRLTTGKTGHSKVDVYGASDGNIGNERGDTFWAAARQIVEQSFAVLAPGGHACWVVKAFVRKGQVVDFPDQWRRLCEAVGFETLHLHRCWLVEHHGEQQNFSGDVDSIETHRKSFFRRLHEKKNPDSSIDFEIVFCMVKPR